MLCRLVVSLGLGLTAGSALAQDMTLQPEILQPHLFDVGGGRRLNMTCVGEGSPTVVFEQGGEGSLVNWRRVQKPISAMTRTCFYDRAGFGFSDPPAGPVTGLDVTDDLRALLTAADVDGPIILVGHSIGGFYATLYADRFFEDVVGLVLIEPGFAGQFDPASLTQRRREQAAIAEGYDWLSGCADLARAGRLTREDPQGCFRLGGDRTGAETAYLLRMHTRPHWYEAEASQSHSYFPAGDEEPESWRQERLARRSFDALPMRVLSAEVVAREQVQDDAAHAAFVVHWRAGHQALAARSTRGTMETVAGAGHFIQLDKPDVVIDAVRRVLEQARHEAH